MRLAIVLSTLLVLVASTADAQRGGVGGGRTGGMGGVGGARTGGMGGGRGGAMGRAGAREAKLKFPSAKAIEKYNPAALLLDKRKKLSLTDAQVAQLKDLRQRIFDRNASLLARYDSVQREFRPPRLITRPGDGQGAASDPAADSTRRVALFQMRQLRTLADSLLARRRVDVREVTGVLSDDTQRIRAADFLVDQDAKFSDEFPAAVMRRDDAGDRPARGGRRPPAAVPPAAVPPA